jgi:hypothetical protein
MEGSAMQSAAAITSGVTNGAVRSGMQDGGWERAFVVAMRELKDVLHAAAEEAKRPPEQRNGAALRARVDQARKALSGA